MGLAKWTFNNEPSYGLGRQADHPFGVLTAKDDLRQVPQIPATHFMPTRAPTIADSVPTYLACIKRKSCIFSGAMLGFPISFGKIRVELKRLDARWIDDVSAPGPWSRNHSQHCRSLLSALIQVWNTLHGVEKAPEKSLTSLTTFPTPSCPPTRFDSQHRLE